ncbi:MAG TPA: diacylglycerol kinase family protein [Aggregatilineales bacterium]|nr:diacylglycerol kinase family protein [Aggregatilineales bacterium]
MKSISEYIRRTLAINPEKYSAKVSENRVRSFSYALAGCLHMLRYAKNVRIQMFAALAVISISLWLGLSRVEWAVIALIIGLNWFAEFMNAAIEATVNLASPEYHPMAQLAKDVAAGAVLLTAILSVIIALLLLVPPLWEKFS